MARRKYHALVKRVYIIHMLLRDTNELKNQPDSHKLKQQLLSDLSILHGIDTTRYLHPRTHVRPCLQRAPSSPASPFPPIASR
ncbi:hypothetical protein BDZ97DRAFT_1797254 [Flammula alnicola]|nr:hypothetical protein BDZ97DRAFT_1797254 [Flammula alnicola]